MTMNRIGSIALAAALACMSLAASRENSKAAAPPNLPKGVKFLQDLKYVEHGHERNRLDLYLPEKAAEKAPEKVPHNRLPLIVWIHGGGWQAGSKESTPCRVSCRQGLRRGEHQLPVQPTGRLSGADRRLQGGHPLAAGQRR